MRTGRIGKGNVRHFDGASCGLGLETRLIEGVDVRLAVDEGEELPGSGSSTTKCDHVRRNTVDGGSSDDDREEYGEDGTDVVHLTARKHGNALPKGEAHGSEDDEELGTKHNRVQQALLMSQFQSAVEELCVSRRHPLSQTKGMRGPDIPKDSLSKRARLRVNAQNLGFNASVDPSCDASHDEQSRNDTAEDECEFPLRDEGNDEGSDKGGRSLEDLSQLLPDAGLDEFAVGCSLHGDGPCDTPVEEGDILGERGAEVCVTDVTGEAEADVGQEA